ncbi:porin [Caballeronia sp. GAWG2-1]|uniref:porin n=1 Tax=Caballeronia sp. GAWG2-1 TaxID=2921744 RepID=UPI00202827A2
MKVKFMICATLGILASPTWAQSSVTLYGIIDAGLTFNSNANGERQYAMTSGNQSGSRLGFRGLEDLGGGLSTVFNIEAGYSTTTGAMGQNGTLFGRQAYVGIISKSYGQVTLGRQYSTLYDFFAGLTSGNTWAAVGTGYGSHPADLDNLDSSNRVNNTVKYQTAVYHGFSMGTMYSFGNVAGTMSRNAIWGLAGSYSQGPITVAAGYQSTHNPNYSFWGNKANDSSTASNMRSPVFVGYSAAGQQDILGAGLSYALGPATLGFIYSNTRFRDMGSVAVSGLTAQQAALRGTASFNSYEANGRYMVSPSLLLGLAYIYTRGGGAGGIEGANYHQVNVGADYFVSKRTDLYAVVAYEQVAGFDSTGKPAVAALVGTTPSSTSKQTVAVVGIRHKF